MQPLEMMIVMARAIRQQQAKIKSMERTLDLVVMAAELQLLSLGSDVPPDREAQAALFSKLKAIVDSNKQAGREDAALNIEQELERVISGLPDRGA